MIVTPGQAALGLWGLFVLSWWASSLWTAKAVSRGAARARLTYLLGFAIAFGLLFTIPPEAIGAGRHVRFGFGGFLPAAWQRPLWQEPAAVGWLLVATEAAAFAFAWWARIHLGRLWSGMLTLREGHRVVDSGPYARVRHPIYTGFIAASWALALVLAAGPPLIGAALLTAVMTIKAGAEETLLRRELGAAAYDAYARRTPMLIPFAPR